MKIEDNLETFNELYDNGYRPIPKDEEIVLNTDYIVKSHKEDMK